MANLILHKGYYVFSVNTLEIKSERISNQEDALSAWKRIRRERTGSEKFAILWVPYDNFAWGESPPV